MKNLMVKTKTWRTFSDCHFGQDRLREIINYKLNCAWTVFLPNSGPFFPASTSFLHPLHTTGRCRGWGMGVVASPWHSLSCAPSSIAGSLLQQSCSTSHSSHQEPAPTFPGLYFLQDTSPCSMVWIWSLFMGSTQTSAPPRLLPSFPQAAGGCALTPGEPPSPHLSPQSCFLLFFPPRSSLLCSGKANLSSQRDRKKTQSSP